MRRSMLLHPLAVAAVLALLLNDHVLKAALPGFVTGKLSDVAGLVFFPLLLAVVVGTVVRRDARRLVPAAAAATVIGFALVKLTAAGAAAFAWSIGAAQWLVVIALTGHAILQPAAVAQDPTDLLALPVVLVAVLIAHRSVPSASPALPSWARMAPVAMALLMAASTMATSQSATPEVGAHATTAITLTAEHPAVSRHISWSAGPLVQARVASGRVSLSATQARDGSVAGAGPDDGVVVLLLPDDPTTANEDPAALDPVAQSGELVDPGTSALLFEGPCQPVCHGGATAVVRWTTGDLPPDGLALDLEALVTLAVPSEAAASSATTSISFDPGGFEGVPTNAAATKRGSLSVSAKGPEAHVDLTITIAADALPNPLDYPLVGYAVISATRTGSGLPDAAAAWTATIGKDDFSSWLNGSGSVADNILRTCLPRTGCRIPIVLTATYDGEVMGPDAHPPADATVAVDYVVTVRLEAYDGRTIPADAVTITVAK